MIMSLVTVMLATLVIGTAIGCLCLFCAIKCLKQNAQSVVLDPAPVNQQQRSVANRRRSANSRAQDNADARSTGSHALPVAEEPMQTQPNNQIMDTEEGENDTNKGPTQFREDMDDETDIEHQLKKKHGQNYASPQPRRFQQ